MWYYWCNVLLQCNVHNVLCSMMSRRDVTTRCVLGHDWCDVLLQHNVRNVLCSVMSQCDVYRHDAYVCYDLNGVMCCCNSMYVIIMLCSMMSRHDVYRLGPK